MERSEQKREEKVSEMGNYVCNFCKTSFLLGFRRESYILKIDLEIIINQSESVLRTLRN